MDETITETSADAPRPPGSPGEAGPGDDGEPARPRRRWLLPALLTPLVVLIVLVIAWAVDTSSGGVARNVQLAGTDVGNLSEAELAAEVADLAEEFTEAPVEIVADGDTYATTADAIGLRIDEDRTVEGTLDVGHDTFALLRPFEWARSFLSEHDAPVAYQVNGDQVATATVELEGEDRVPATEPTVELVEGSFRVVPGKAGTGLDPAEVAAALPAAAAAVGEGDGPIRVELERGPIPPLGEDAAAEQAAAGAEALVSAPVEIQTSGGNRTISSEELRTWVVLTTAPDGTVAVDLDPAKVDPSLREHFDDIAGGPVDARFTVEGGKPVIIPEQAGKVCCGGDPAARIIDALRTGTRTVTLDLVDGAPAFTAAEAAKLGIVEEVGQPSVFGPTTMHACCESRVQNIHRIADLIRGQVIEPGETFSVNSHVGRRTVGNGFTEGGAIIDGRVGKGIGGGISQFATTFFNAALYAGLDFGEYQSHSLYISRYPRGHEATLSFPSPDLEIRNTTPYGVLVWPTYTDTSITVHLYSTRYVDVAVGEPSPSPAGNCTKWTTPRTRTYLDGRVERDSVFARYRPAEGINC
ncbi:MAG: VanW family protein [Acidimicrobiales bacterium]|nr:VanW family protein [Acidimicrobiales bacterium]